MPLNQIIRPGDRIQHPIYGVGTVQKMWRSGRELVAKVKWELVQDRFDSFFGRSESFTVVITPHVVLFQERSN